MQKTTAEIWQEYQKGVDFNNSLDFYEKVRRNERFYLGRQWEGLKAPDLEQPVLNFLRRVISYFIAMLVSDDIGIGINSYNRSLESDIADSALAHEVERVMERCKLRSLNRDIIRDAAIEGGGCLYLRFNAKSKEIEAERLLTEQLIFGNPYDAELQRQPYLIISQRIYLDTLREEARKLGISDWEAIYPDEAAYGDDGDELCTVLTRLWRDEEGRVHYSRSTRDIMLQADVQTAYKLYPICLFSWEKVKHNYHGQAAITDGVIQNQIFVNTMWALFMIQAKKSTFPTVFYDATKIDSWRNRPGGAIAVQGSPDSNVVMNYRPADFSQQALELVHQTIEYTKEFMGVSDAALGNIARPENASAIIAVQQAAAAPLDVQRLAFYQFVEDSVRIIIDIICCDYGLRETEYAAAGERIATLLDFSDLDTDSRELNVDIGAGSYWSETMQVETMDNLFAKGIIRDAATYLEGVPDKYVRNKQKILEALRALPNEESSPAADPLLMPSENIGLLQ